MAALGVGAGFAFARSSTPTIGTGVVVVNTKLSYQGGAAAGTGIVLTSSGEVLTNNHVIQGETSVQVVVPGTNHKYSGKVVGYDVSADVAVIQLSGASNLKTASLGDSSKVTAGQTVKALGNAGGTGALSSATGTVTGLGKSITVSDDQGGTEQLAGPDPHPRVDRVHLDPFATKASCLPSGDHVGLMPGAIVSMRAPVVALTITTMRSLRVAAIARPSGDHRGGRT